MQCNPQRTDNDSHIVEALQNLDTPFPMRMLIELGGPMGGGEKVIGSQRGSAVYTAIEKMFNKAPGLTKGKPVHPKIKELYEKYGPLDMEQCLKKSGADLNFTAGRYKHHSEDKDKSSQIIGQYNVKEKKFEGFVRRISYNLVFEGVWSDDPS